MDYITEEFNGMRIVPERKLELPLNIIYQSKDRYTSFKIYKGVLYRAKSRQSLHAYNERDLSLIATNETKPFIAGLFGFSNNTMLCPTKNGKTCEIDTNNLNVLTELDLGVIFNSQTVVYHDFSLLTYRDDVTTRGHIKLGWKNNNENKLDWSFESDRVIKCFAINEDKSKVGLIETDGTITVLDALTGNTLWSKDVDNLGVLSTEELEWKTTRGLGAIANSLHIYRDQIICGYPYSYLISIDLLTGKLLWKRKNNTETLRLTVTDKGFVYYVDNYYTKSETPKLLSVDCITGETSKEFELDIDEKTRELFDASYSDVTTTHFWGASSKGFLYAINLKTGEIDWQYHLGFGMPGIPFFICNNRLYIRRVTEDFIFEGQGGYISD